MLERIERRLEEARGMVIEVGYSPEDLAATEFHDYLTGETLSGDRIDLDDVLESDCLMIHEVVEISELKRGGVRIDRETVVNLGQSDQMYQAHLKAIECEVEFALRQGNLPWIRARADDVRSWLEHKCLNKEMAGAYARLLQRLERHVSFGQVPA